MKIGRLILDPEKITVGPEGLDPFVWPIAQDEIAAVRDRFLSGLAEIGRAGAQARDEATQVLDIMVIYWVATVLTAYRACALVQRCKTSRIELQATERNAIVFRILAGEAPPPESYVARLINGPPARSLLWRVLRDCRNLTRRETMRHRSFWRGAMSNAIVAITTGPILEMQAAAAGEPVFCLPHNVWFSSVRRTELEPARREMSRLVAEVLQVVETAFSAGNAELPGFVAKWISEQIAASLAATWVHYKRLIGKPRRLPKRLWTGSNGSPFTRMLRRAVRLNGGATVGHDHGTGTGVFYNFAAPLLEFVDCDRFVTFSEVQAATLRQVPGTEWMISPRRPEIVPVSRGQSRAVDAHGNGARGKSGPRKILYMDTIFTGDRVWFVPLPSDAVTIDWAARLVAKLQSWGHEVTYKLHPSEGRLPRPLQEQFSLATCTVRFEEIYRDYDLILYDMPHSTTLPLSLMSDKDVVIIDRQLLQWGPGALDLLQRRCPVVPAGYDTNNRQTIDWDQLRDAIHAAGGRRDPAFVQAYFRPH
jgi:hypothetical protein